MKWMPSPPTAIRNCGKAFSRASAARQSKRSFQYATNSRMYARSVPYPHPEPAISSGNRDAKRLGTHAGVCTADRRPRTTDDVLFAVGCSQRSAVRGRRGHPREVGARVVDAIDTPLRVGGGTFGK